MAQVYEAPISKVGKTHKVGSFTATKCKTLKEYVSAVLDAGNEIEKDDDFARKLKLKVRGKVYRLRPAGKKQWIHVVLDRRRSTTANSEKTDVLNMRMTAGERNRWSIAANLDDRTLAGWVRHTLNLACKTCAACTNYGIAEIAPGDPFPDDFWCSHYEKLVHNPELAKKCPAFRWSEPEKPLVS